MKTLIVLILFISFAHAQEVTVNPDGSVTLKLSKQEAENCKKGGGCVVMPVKDLEPIVREAAQFMCGKTI